MKGIILHGGHGTRLRPLTHTGPKQLLPIANKPMSEYCVEAIRNCGISEIAIIIGGIGSNKVKEYYGTGSKFNVNITYIEQDSPKGIAHAINLCKEFIGNEKFLVFLGDNIIQKPINDIAKKFEISDYEINEYGCKGNKIIVKDTVGTDGKDKLVSIEKLIFADGTYENGVFTAFNRAPIANKDSAVLDEDTSVIISVLANDSDPDGDPLTVTNIENVYNGTVVINADGTITYTPDPDFHGTESIVYTIQDPDGAYAKARVNITINEVDDPVEPNLKPVLGKDSATTTEDSSVTINVLANDVDPNGDTITVTSVQGLSLN